MSRRSEIRRRRAPDRFDEDGRLLDDYKAEVLFRCGRCSASLWHALAHLTTTGLEDEFSPFLVEPTPEGGGQGVGRLDHLHVPMLSMADWSDDARSESQLCPGCRHSASISRQRTYLRLHALWEEAEAAKEPRRVYVAT